MARNSNLQKKRSQHKPRPKKRNPSTNNESFQKLRDWLMPDDGIFLQIKLHGNIKWQPRYLVWLALCWAWMEARCLTDAFEVACDDCRRMFGCTPLKTYPGFVNALVSHTANLLPVLRKVMHERMKQVGVRFWRLDGWLTIAFDGSRSSAPRSCDNEKALCAANYGHGKTARYRKKKSKGMRRKQNEKNKPAAPEPQVWITLLWHVGLRLPWDWRLGPSNSSERDHVQEMVQNGRFPKNTLFCGDAGFSGYPFWSSLLGEGRDFLVRVGGNVHLLLDQVQCKVEAENRKKDQLVLCWPKTASKAGQPPLRLRLVQIRLNKKTVAWMLTSVRDPKRLSARTILRIYQMRWGIEVEFRGLKQTLDRAKLRSRNVQNLYAELNWSILAMAAAELFALKEQLEPRSSKHCGRRKSIDPVKRSLAKTMRAIRWCLRNLDKTPEPGLDLAARLRCAVTDGYQRRSSKRPRYRPPNPDKKAMGDPKLRPMTKDEIKILKNSGPLLAA